MNIRGYKEYLEEGQKKDPGLFYIVDKVREARDKLREASIECKNDPESMRERLWSAMKVWINTMRIYHYRLHILIL